MDNWKLKKIKENVRNQNTVTEIKNAIDRVIIRVGIAKEVISELENVSGDFFKLKCKKKI